MDIEQRNLVKHLFICCNEKDPSKDCCATKKPQTLISNLKQRLRDDNLWDQIKVTKSGCLGPCSQGISATLYPENLLITGINLQDEDKIYELLTK